jgi:hypothetical protein
MATLCRMLRRYASAKDASETIAILRRAHGGRERFALFDCPECRGWHLSPKRESRDLRVEAR